mmetsp:Transcript_1495/g.9150  ORF Transcript_1495/g.9150 Transcript_1495/m.9150 type:complete len:307 (+) Transcript_1495:150-1070(+)
MGWRRRDPTRGIHGWRNGRKRTRCAWIRHQPRQAQNTQRIERKVQSHRHGKIRPRQIRSSALGLRQIQQAETKPETTGRGPQSMGQSDETARTSMKPPSPSRMERTQIKKKMSHTQDDEVDANRRKREDEKEHEGSCSTRVRPTDCLCLKKKREGKDGKNTASKSLRRAASEPRHPTGRAKKKRNRTTCRSCNGGIGPPAWSKMQMTKCMGVPGFVGQVVRRLGDHPKFVQRHETVGLQRAKHHLHLSTVEVFVQQMHPVAELGRIEHAIPISIEPMKHTFRLHPSFQKVPVGFRHVDRLSSPAVG